MKHGNEEIDFTSGPKKTFWVRRRELMRAGKNPRGFFVSLEQKHTTTEFQALGITSRIRNNNGQSLHIPLIDFCCEKPDTYGPREIEERTHKNLETIAITLESLGLRKGYIMDSGNSYHFIGEQVMPWAAYKLLLQKMEEYTIIGKRWPEHQIVAKRLNERSDAKERKFSVLRVLACPEADKPYDPFLIERFENNQIHLF